MKNLLRDAIEYLEEHCDLPKSKPLPAGGGAPQWLIDQMDRLKKLPPPTLEEVEKQWAASARQRRENAHCPRHKEYNMVNSPEGNCDHCWQAYIDWQQTKESVRLFHEAMEKFGYMQS